MEISSWSQLAYQVVVKPIGPICNLRCRYCFYLDTESLYPAEEDWRMTEETLEEFIRQFVAAQPEAMPEIFFMFQGGEPTLMGLEFYRLVVELQQKYVPPGKRIFNSIQTNGILLDDQWCEFLKANSFLVGLSLDGPEEYHDAYRTDPTGQGSFARVAQGLRCLQKHGIPFNVLACIHRKNAEHPLRVYRFLREHGVSHVQFDPVVCPADDTKGTDWSSNDSPERLVTPESVLPDQFGRFLITVFDEWLRHDMGKISVSEFDQALSAWLGTGPSMCVYQPICGRSLSLEHNGDLYACEQFVDPAHRLANIHERTISEMFNTASQQQFGFAKSTGLPTSCKNCDVCFVCNGGCQKHRFIGDAAGERGLNFLCAGYQKFYRHIAPTMKTISEKIRASQPIQTASARP